MSQANSDQIAHQISYDYRHRLERFNQLSVDQQTIVLLKLTKHIQHQIITQLDDQKLVNILEQTYPNEATDLIQLLDKKHQKRIISQLNQHLQKTISILLKFDPETAAGLMDLDYIQVELGETIKQVAKQVKVHEKRTGKIPTIIVVSNTKLVGQLPIYKLALAETDDLIDKHHSKIMSVKYDTNYKKVINHFRQNPHNKVVVVGDTDQVLGVIYTDDILRLIRRQDATSLYNFAGVQDEETIYDSTLSKVKFRYKWLIINLATSFIAASTVGLFDQTISKHVLLAVYMPIVAGMGGNAATQTLAVMVRGLSQHALDKASILNTLKNEVSSGLINGGINGVIVAAIVMLLNQDLKLALVLAAAMIFNLFIAATFGTLVPVLMKRLGKDPASSATIFITTATDVFGFLAFLGLASLILG